jgi:hypothetical protein
MKGPKDPGCVVARCASPQLPDDGYRLESPDTPWPRMQPREVSLLSQELPMDTDGGFPFQKAYRIGHVELRGNAQGPLSDTTYGEFLRSVAAAFHRLPDTGAHGDILRRVAGVPLEKSAFQSAGAAPSAPRPNAVSNLAWHSPRSITLAR